MKPELSGARVPPLATRPGPPFGSRSIKCWRRVVGYGLAVWAIPFAAGLFIFPLRDSHRDLFESLMAVAIVFAAVVCGLRYLRRSPVDGIPQGLALGAAWMAVNILADQFFFTWGPMRMPPGEYLRDIGATYLVVPVITAGLAAIGKR